MGFSFAHLSDWMPLERRLENEQVVAFDHPRPSHKLHILIVPKASVPNFLAADGAILQALYAAAQQLASELQLDRLAYRTVINGGAYQDVPQLHMHLVSDAEAAKSL